MKKEPYRNRIAKLFERAKLRKLQYMNINVFEKKLKLLRTLRESFMALQLILRRLHVSRDYYLYG